MTPPRLVYKILWASFTLNLLAWAILSVLHVAYEPIIDSMTAHLLIGAIQIVGLVVTCAELRQDGGGDG